MNHFNSRVMDFVNGADHIERNGKEGQQMGHFQLPENVILHTTNYAMFKFDELNRPVREKKVERMMEIVNRRNLLHLFPIVVTRKLEIVDGQHRLKVAEALNVPIYYIVSDQMETEDAALVNEAVDKWKADDWLHHWCKRGMPEYLKFKAFHEANSWLVLSAAVRLCHYGDVGGRNSGEPISKLFAKGNYKANNVNLANRVCAMAKDFSVWFPHWDQGAFISTLRNLAINDEYDHKRMMQKMQHVSTRLVKCMSVDDYMKLINDIYNWKAIESKTVELSRMGSTSPKRNDRE